MALAQGFDSPRSTFIQTDWRFSFYICQGEPAGIECRT